MTDDSKKPDFSDVVSGGSSTAPPGSTGGPGVSDLEKQMTMRMYVVESGDSLSKIAQKFYGDASAWKRIYEENRELIHNPDMIQPGWRLKIPE
ncbi:MAG: LysM peptidoglycan-binding domain-containing protein [Acidobacteriota bacterium]